MTVVYRRPGSPYWYVDLTIDGTRRRVSTGCTAKPEARRVAAQRAAEFAAEAARPGSPVTLGDALDRYVRLLERRGASSLRNVKTLADKLVGRGVFAGSAHHLDSTCAIHLLRSHDVTRLHAARIEAGNSVQTANHEVKVLRAAIRLAQEHGHKTPELVYRLPTPPQKTRYLSWEEFERVHRALDPEAPLVTRWGTTYTPDRTVRGRRQDAQDLLVALVMTGGRWSEIAALTWDMVDTTGWSRMRLWGFKDREERVVPLPLLAADMLKRRWQARTNALLVFPGRDPDAQRAGPSRAIARAMDAAGLNDARSVARYGRATIHSLRHTFASWLLQRGLSLPEVQQLLGHASADMTARYAHLATGATINRALEALNQETPCSPSAT